MLRNSGPTSISLTACCPRYRVQRVRTQVDSSIETSPSPVDRELDIRFRKLGVIRQDTIGLQQHTIYVGARKTDSTNQLNLTHETTKPECGPMSNVMAAQLNVRGALC